MGEISCRLNADAIKPTILYCTEPAAYMHEESVATAAWATAVATALLAVFAFAAWLSSRNTLKLMREQLDAQKRDAETAIEASRQLAMDTKQDSLLADYSVALLDLADGAGKPETDIKLLQSRITRSWMAWAMHLFRNDRDFRQLTAEWNEHFVGECEALAEIKDDGEDSSAHATLIFLHSVNIRNNMSSYIGNLQVWQTTEEQRPEIYKKLLVICADSAKERSETEGDSGN